MYPSGDTRQLSLLLRAARELDIVGDVTATVDHPSDLRPRHCRAALRPAPPVLG